MDSVGETRAAPRRWTGWRIAARPALAMARLDVSMLLTALTPYAVVAIATGLTAFVLQNDLTRIQEDGLLVLGDPFAVPLYGGVLLLAVYSATSAALAVAREREHGATELLCYGPVSPFSYLLAKFCSHLAQYAALLGLLLGSYLLLSAVTGLQLRGLTVLALVLSCGPAAAATGLGLMVAALVRRVRPAVLVVLAVALGAVGLQLAREVLVRLPAPEFHVNPVLVLRWAAVAMSSITGWVLPFGYIDRELSAVLRGDPAAAWLATGAAGVYAAVVLVLSAISLDRTGVRR